MNISRFRTLAVAVASPLAAVLLMATPAAAAKNHKIDITRLAFSASEVDATSGAATVQLSWTVIDHAAAATTVSGTVELRRFAGSAVVGQPLIVTYALNPGDADVWAASGDVHRSNYEYEVRVPQYATIASSLWRVTKLTATDDLGHTRTLTGPPLARQRVQFTATQLVDDVAPTTDRVSLDLGQRSAIYDDGNTPIKITYAMFITDVGLGFAKGTLAISGPQGRSASGDFEIKDVGEWAPECGDDNPAYDPTYLTCSVSITLPAESPSGSWTPSRLSLTDAAGNTRVIDQVTGPTVRVSRNDVLSARDFTLTPTVVDNWRQRASADLTFKPSGAVGDLVEVTIQSTWCSQPSKKPATHDDGTTSVEIQISDLHSGCQIEGVALKDAAGNEAFYGTAHGAPDLGLALTRMPDTIPPVVLSASLNKSTWTQSEIDSAWGIGFAVVVDTNSPAPVSGYSATLYDVDGVSRGGASGGIHEGDGHLALAVHARGLEPGQYTIGFTITDAAGNRVQYGYPNRNNPPPGGPLVLTVIAG